jgi:hypothetical protein
VWAALTDRAQRGDWLANASDDVREGTDLVLIGILLIVSPRALPVSTAQRRS